MEYYTAIKMNNLFLHATIWTNLFLKGSIKAKHKTVHSMVPTTQSSKSGKLIYDVKSQDGSYPLQGAGETRQG